MLLFVYLPRLFIVLWCWWLLPFVRMGLFPEDLVLVWCGFLAFLELWEAARVEVDLRKVV